MQRRELYYKIHIIRLDFCFVGCAVAHYLAALRAFMYQHEAVLGVGLSADRTEYTAALVGSVAGVYIHVKRAEAKRTVVTRGEAKRENLPFAILTDKAGVVF